LVLAVESIEEEARKVDEAQISKEEEFERHLSNFRSSHFTRIQLRQAKKHKKFISALMKAGASVEENDNNQSDHYFSFPFRTWNNSLAECIQTMPCCNDNCIDDIKEDEFFSVRREHKIVIDLKSIESLRPLNIVDDSVVDLFSSW
jgi:hypothetical protein